MLNSVNRPVRAQQAGEKFRTVIVFPDTVANHEDLIHRILQRIEHRLPGRIRQLAVYSTGNAIVLSGQCSTYYTKQVAQHVAMGVLEYERLINNIDVDVPK